MIQYHLRDVFVNHRGVAYGITIATIVKISATSEIDFLYIDRKII